MSELYISCDIEADGPIPGPHSMLSFGCAAFFNGQLIGTCTRNLETLPDAVGAQDTMEWWATQPDAWAAHRRDLVAPQKAMEGLVAWLDEMSAHCGGKKPVFVGYPAAYDFMFIAWYLQRFAKQCPFGWSALDMKTLAMVKLGTEYRKSTKKNFPKFWFNRPEEYKNLSHSHVALDDAIEQGFLFQAMRLPGLPDDPGWDDTEGEHPAYTRGRDRAIDIVADTVLMMISGEYPDSSFVASDKLSEIHEKIKLMRSLLHVS